MSLGQISAENLICKNYFDLQKRNFKDSCFLGQNINFNDFYHFILWRCRQRKNFIFEFHQKNLSVKCRPNSVKITYKACQLVFIFSLICNS